MAFMKKQGIYSIQFNGRRCVDVHDDTIHEEVEVDLSLIPSVSEVHGG